MPIINIDGAELDLPRNLALLDTNVLVAIGDDRDNDHEQAMLVFEELSEFQFGVTPPVILETLGMLTSRRGRETAIRMGQWILTPGNVIVLPALHPPTATSDVIGTHVHSMNRFSIDFVDSHLMHAADLLTSSWSLKPHAPIVTFDTKDFFKCAPAGYLYSLYDMRELDLVVFA